MFILLAQVQGASAYNSTTTTSADKVVVNGITTFLIGTNAICGTNGTYSSLTQVDGSCGQSISNNTNSTYDLMHLKNRNAWINVTQGDMNRWYQNQSKWFSQYYAWTATGEASTPAEFITYALGLHANLNNPSLGNDGIAIANQSNFFGYHIDEPEGSPLATVATLETLYTAMRANDSSHVYVTNLCCNPDGIHGLTTYNNTADVFGWDRYPYSTAFSAWNLIDALYGWAYYSAYDVMNVPDAVNSSDLDAFGKPVFTIIQANALDEGIIKVPPNTMVRANVYQAIALGVDGIIIWHYNNIPETTLGHTGLVANKTKNAYVQQLLGELALLEPILLLPRQNFSWHYKQDWNAVSFTNNTPKSISKTTSIPTQMEKFTYRLMKNTTTNKYYLIVVNLDQNQTVSQVSIKALWSNTSMNATVLGYETGGSQPSGTTFEILGGNFTKTFNGFEAVVYEISGAAAEEEPPTGDSTYSICGSGCNTTWQEASTGDGTLRHNDGNVWISDKLSDYVAYYDFQEGSGTSLNDLSTNLNTGTLTGTNASDWMNDGLRYDGIDNFVNISDSASLSFTNALSVVVKLKNYSAPLLNARVISKYDTDNRREWNLFLNPSGYLQTSFGTADCTAIQGTTNSSSRPVNGTIQTVGFGWDSTNQNVTHWVDGVQTTYISQLAKSTNICSSNREVMLGKYRTADSLLFLGEQYKVKIFARNLSASDWLTEANTPYNASGNRTVWHNWTDGNVTYQIVVNATTPTNTNYTILGRQNATGDFQQLSSSGLTGNTTLGIGAPLYENLDVRIQLFGNETATPELIAVTYYAQAAATSDPSTSWTYGIMGTFFQNNSIGSNNSCINQGGGAIGANCIFADNFDDNNYNGWFINDSGTWTPNNGTINQTGANGYLVQNVTHTNAGVFTKFKEYGVLTSYMDVLRIRGNTTTNYQLSMGSPTTNRSSQYYFVYPSTWNNINSSITKTRYLLDSNYVYNAVYGTNFLTYHSNVSYASAMTTPLVTGSDSNLSSGTQIAFGGSPNVSAIVSWNETRVVNLSASGVQNIQGNYSMNYTVPASQYAKNITINGTYASGTNYSLKYRQNATGSYVAVEGIKTANTTIELPTPYYQSIDILLEMNSTESDTLWITNITVGVSATTVEATSIYNTGYQYVLVNDTMTNSQLNTLWSPTWIIGWNSTSQKWETYKSGWPIRLSRISNKGDAVGIKITTNKSVQLTYNETYNWTLVPGWNLIGIE